MIFVINNLKYDIDKMELISEKCEHAWKSLITEMSFLSKEVKLYRSKKNNWLLTYKKDGFSKTFASALTEDEAKSYLIKYDLEKYEEIYGELEEA